MKDTLVLMAFATLLNERGRGKVDNSYSDAWYSGGGGGYYFPLLWVKLLSSTDRLHVNQRQNRSDFP